MTINNGVLPYAQSFYETTLAQSINATQTTIQVTTAPANQAGYLVIEPNSSNREIVYFYSVTGTTLTVVRGISETNTVDDTGGTGTSHAAGVQVAMKDVHYYFNKVVAAYRGDNASGFNTFAIGDGNTTSAANRMWYAYTSSISAFWGLSSNGRMVVSEDGVNSYVISAGGSGVTAGAGIDITAGSVTTANLSTGGIVTSALKNAIGVSTGLNRNASGIYIDQASAMYWTGLHNFTDISVDSVQLSAAVSAINAVIDGRTSTTTAANLNTLTDGSTTDLHNHIGNLGYFNGWYTMPLPFVNLASSQWRITAAAGSTHINEGGAFVMQNNSSILFLHTPLGQGAGGITMNPNFNAWSTLSAKSVTISVEAPVLINTASVGYIFGFGIQDINSNYSDATRKFEFAVNASTKAGAWFAISSSNVYACTCDRNATISYTNLSANVTVASISAGFKFLRVDIVSGLSAKFYVNGTLALSNTNVCNSSASYQVGVWAGGANDAGVYTGLGPVIYKSKLY